LAVLAELCSTRKYSLNKKANTISIRWHGLCVDNNGVLIVSASTPYTSSTAGNENSDEEDRASNNGKVNPPIVPDIPIPIIVVVAVCLILIAHRGRANPINVTTVLHTILYVAIAAHYLLYYTYRQFQRIFIKFVFFTTTHFLFYFYFYVHFCFAKFIIMQC
jgi:hypothetical protein